MLYLSRGLDWMQSPEGVDSLTRVVDAVFFGTAARVVLEDLRFASTLLLATGMDLRVLGRAFTLVLDCVSRFGASLLDARTGRVDGGVSAAKVVFVWQECIVRAGSLRCWCNRRRYG